MKYKFSKFLFHSGFYMNINILQQLGSETETIAISTPLQIQLILQIPTLDQHKF